MAGQAQGTSAGKTGPGAPLAQGARAAPLPARTCGSRRGPAQRGSARGRGTARPARPAWLLAADGPDAADRKGGREGGCEGRARAPDKPRCIFAGTAGHAAGLRAPPGGRPRDCRPDSPDLGGHGSVHKTGPIRLDLDQLWGLTLLRRRWRAVRMPGPWKALSLLSFYPTLARFTNEK